MENQKNDKKKRDLTRREFIKHAGAGAALMAMTPIATMMAQGQKAPIVAWAKGANAYKFHMIGNGHIDPVWLWPWKEGISIVHSTFQSALDRMNENPDFVFTCSSTQFYEWVAENDPTMLKEIRKRVQEGRWAAVGGWWVEPDMNIPSGESMVRQGLYGQLILEKLIGVRATTAFCIDSFGHAQSVPQIISKQGMDNYVMMRPGPHEKNMPYDLFWWEGTDGTKVLTYRIPVGYTYSNPVKVRLDTIIEKGFGNPTKNMMAFYGVGDHGGGPTKANLQSIDEIKAAKDKKAPTLLYSSPDQYFEEIRADKSIAIPTVNDELQHHAVGCYTADWEIKKGNRISEAALVTAEKITTIGSIAWDANYPKERFTSAWKRTLFMQFHDSAAGSSLADHTKDAKEAYGYSLDIANESTYMATQKLEWRVAAEDPDSEYLIVFNPHAWEVKGTIEYDFGMARMMPNSRVDDENGNPLPHQVVIGQTITGGRKTLVTEVTVPAMGYRQIRIRKADAPQPGNAVKATKNMLENEYYKISFSDNGSIGVLDKETGKELFSGGTTGCKAVVIEDLSDTWSHRIVSYDKEIGRFERATLKVIEEGPLRATMRVISHYGNSDLTIDWQLTAGSREIDAKVTLNWHERQKMLKFSFPVNIENHKATYETPYGFIERQTIGEEDPGLRWFDLTGNQNGRTYGLTVMNDAKYGYSIKENDMRITVNKSAPYGHHDPNVLDPASEYIWMDQGIQTFKMLLVPHKGTWKETGITRIAEAFTAPLVCTYQGIHKGTMPKSGSFLSVDATNINVSSIKYSEEGSDIIIRCVEEHGLSVNATIDLKFLNKTWKGSFKPNEIKTLRLNPRSGVIKETNLLEE